MMQAAGIGIRSVLRVGGNIVQARISARTALYLEANLTLPATSENLGYATRFRSHQWSHAAGEESARGWSNKRAVATAVAAVTALTGSGALCEVLEEDSGDDSPGDEVVRRGSCNLCEGDSDSMSIYFDAEYEPKKLLGCGTFGVVMQCVHKQTGRVAAVKMVQEITGNQEEVEREKMALECLNALAAIKLVSQLASALQFMHQQDIVHRDLKPENIMALVNSNSKCRGDANENEDVTLKIIDFGRIGGQDTHDDSVGDSVLLASRSPSMSRHDDSHGYVALGCILYILISGRHPFDLTGCSTEEEIVRRVKAEPVSFLLPVWHDVRAETKELIRGLLEKKPRHRLSAEQVLAHPAIIKATKEFAVCECSCAYVSFIYQATTGGDEQDTASPQQTQASLDEWRYQHRLKDAARHSYNLQRDFPEVSDPEQLSFDKYRRRLEEYNREEYGPSPKKKQKVVFEKVDHAREQKSSNQDIFRRLQNELSGRTDRRRIGGVRPVVEEHKHFASSKEDNDIGAASDNETKEETEPTEPSNDDEKNVELLSIVENGTKDETSITAKSRQEEIAELEVKLRAQHLSRTSKADRLFYNRLAEREANTILEEVLLEDIYDIAEDVFDEEEEKSRNKELPPELLEIEVLIQKYNVDITRRHLQCMLPGTWLNDEVINFYFQMMSDRDEALVKAGVLPKRSHFFNSFFYTKIDLFAMDKIFMPVNVGNMHWCMAVIFMTEKRIQYYDSMHGSGAACLKVLLVAHCLHARYLHDESEHKKKQKFNEEGWRLVTTTPDTPQQNNGSDCGVFSCMFADYLSQNKPLSFVQKDIPFHRHRMVLHVSRGYIPLEEEGL
ncbi:Protein kinase, ATP binding site [Phytophthora cactorum]|nr:Protein kinase, ATP binding site [Phytophthora cactorum]